ncbi:hypothetical protein [Trinickia sp.]|uniref:hypothetical protein n=1 Tax=Trinickia sp. TaxID=2571163 RepID=UPI003F7D7DFD
MPRISRGSSASPPPQESVRNPTSPSSPNAAGGSAAGRRERHGLLGFLARPFRGSGSSTRAAADSSASPAQQAEQAPTTRAAPRTAAALLQRSPALARGRGEEVMARIEPAAAETPGPIPQGSPSRAPARGTLTPPAAPRQTPETQARLVVQQLRQAGVDLDRTRRTISGGMQGHPVRIDERTTRVLEQHFPRMSEVGFFANEPLAAALVHSLGLAASEANRAQPAPAGLRPAPTNSPVRNSRTPPRPEGTAAPAASPSHRGRGANDSLMGRLAGSGIEMGRIAAAIDDTLLRGRALPDEIQGALRRAGIETHVGTGRVPVTHPLLQLRREIHLATPEERDPSPPRAQRMPRAARRPRLGPLPIGTSRPSGPDANAARGGLIIPQRADRESNAQFAWRLHNLNPGASVQQVAAETVGPSGHLNLRATIDQLNAMIKTRDQIRAAFSSLRSISKADAERLGFKDAATHGESEATDCTFGEPLSTSNPSQRVIGLVNQPSDPKHAYNPEHNKEPVFMDLNELATYLAGQTQPRHPITNAPLTAKNIRNYAFRIE